MAQTYFPFDSGQGANLTEAQWSEMAQYWLTTGVLQGALDSLEVYANSTGLQVHVKAGAAWIKGHYFESNAQEVLPISSSHPTNPRIDRIVVRLDWIENTIALAVLQGTPAVNPIAPALTQNTSRWEISLAQVIIHQGDTTIFANDVTDERVFVKAYDDAKSTLIEVYKSSIGSIPADVSTLIRFDTKRRDRNNEVESGLYFFKVRESGVYLFSGIVRFDAANYPTNDWYIQLFKNDALDSANSFIVGTNTRAGNIAMPVYLNAGDKIQMAVLQYSGGATKTINYAECRLTRIKG